MSFIFEKRFLVAGVFSFALLFLPHVGTATGNNAYLPKEQAAETNYAAAGDAVEVAGNVASDVYVAGGTVVISGEVGGDVVAVGGKVRITGPVVGSVRVLGGTVELASSVGRNVTVAGGSLLLAEGSHVQGHVLSAGGEVELRGVIEGEVRLAAGQVTMAGTTRGPVELWLDKEGVLRVLDSAIASQSITYHGKRAAEVAVGAQLAQQPEQLPLPIRADHSAADRWFGELAWLFGLAVLAMVLSYLMPKKVQEVAEEAIANPLSSLGWGAAWLVLVPVTVLILFVTVVGIPLAFALLALYVLGLLVAQVMVGAAVGWYVRSRTSLTQLQAWKLLPTVLLGLLAYRLATAIPILGSLVAFVALLWSWGALLRVQRRTVVSF